MRGSNLGGGWIGSNLGGGCIFQHNKDKIFKHICLSSKQIIILKDPG